MQLAIQKPQRQAKAEAVTVNKPQGRCSYIVTSITKGIGSRFAPVDI